MQDSADLWNFPNTDIIVQILMIPSTNPMKEIFITIAQNGSNQKFWNRFYYLNNGGLIKTSCFGEKTYYKLSAKLNKAIYVINFNF